MKRLFIILMVCTICGMNSIIYSKTTTNIGMLENPIVMDTLDECDSIIISEILPIVRDSLIKCPHKLLVNMNNWNVNYSGGLSLEFSITNCTSKPISEITICGGCRDSLGNELFDRVSNGNLWTCSIYKKIGGRPNKEDKGFLLLNKLLESQKDIKRHFIFYNYNIKSIYVKSIYVKYEDGTNNVYFGSTKLSNILSYENDWEFSNKNPYEIFNRCFRD